MRRRLLWSDPVNASHAARSHICGVRAGGTREGESTVPAITTIAVQPEYARISRVASGQSPPFHLVRQESSAVASSSRFLL
jgi:hypothetical protein